MDSPGLIGKAEVDNVEAAENQPFHADEIKRVVRKLDFNLLPLCFVLYTFSVLDRLNLGNAKIAGLQDDIDVSGSRYQWLGNM